MLTHIVIFKYKSEVTEEQREKHVAMLRNLPKTIPNIISFEAGFDILKWPRSYDAGLVAVYPNREALDQYTIHPDHLPVVELSKQICEHVASVDFLTEDK